ncbi:MAG TPA: hypothetical protein VIY96_00010 [Thermoanaerobaculia bacterium]
MTSIAFTSLFLGLVLGIHPVGVAVEGPAAAVALELDGTPIGRADRQPWALDVDLGRDLSPHELVARAFDGSGREIARTRQWLNVPRPPAEATLLLERNAEGRAVATRVTWQSLLGTAPQRVSVTFDGQPLDVSDPKRIALPDYDPDTTHMIAAEVEFSPAVSSRAGLVLGGLSRSEASSELTGVPVRVRKSAMPPPGELQGWFRKGSDPLRVVAVEKGPVLLIVVRDTDHMEALGKLGTGGQTTFVQSNRGSLPQFDPDYRRFETRFADADRVRFVWPRASRVPGSEIPTELFDASRDFPGSIGGLHWLLTRISHPIQKVADERFADAVAVAGLQAYAGYTRRAVVLILGRQIADASQYPPAAVRAYLAKMRVPLFVWSLESRTADRVAAAWGPTEDVSSFAKLKVAFEKLRSELDSQQMVWIEGRHLPQQIALGEKAQGVELVGSGAGLGGFAQ